MRLGMIGLGRMGANMTTRLLAAGHQIVVYDREHASTIEGGEKRDRTIRYRNVVKGLRLLGA